jgi:hypothetical protein
LAAFHRRRIPQRRIEQQTDRARTVNLRQSNGKPDGLKRRTECSPSSREGISLSRSKTHPIWRSGECGLADIFATDYGPKPTVH